VTFDDIVFKKSNSTDPNLVENPGFESSGTGTPVNSNSISQSIAAEAGHKYAVSASISGEMMDPNANWSLSVQFYKSNGTAIGTQVDVLSQASQVVLPAARAMQGVVTAPAGTTSLTVKLAANFAAGRISVSDVKVTLDASTKYYFSGSSRVAVRNGGILQYLLADHLGSTSLAVSTNGNVVIETRYKACPTRGCKCEGEVRYTTPDKTLPTRATYTGQYVNDQATDLGVNFSFGLIYFQARWVDLIRAH
jgi:hypothetical protein